MKTNNGKRLIAAVAILAMVACVFAVAMPAEETEATPASEFIGLAGEGKIINVTQNYTIDDALTLDGYTLNLNGYTLTVSSTINAVNTDIVGGTITSASDIVLVTFQGNSTATDVTFAKATGASSMTDVASGSTVAMDGCVFTGSSTTAVYVNTVADNVETGVKGTIMGFQDCVLSDSVWKEIILAGNGADVSIENCQGLRLNVSYGTASDGNNGVYTLGQDVSIINSDVDRLNVDTRCSFTIPANTTFEVGAIQGSGKIVNNGTLTVYRTSSITTVEGTAADVATLVSDVSAISTTKGNIYFTGILTGEVTIGNQVFTISDSATINANAVLTIAQGSTVVVPNTFTAKTFAVNNGAGETADSVTFKSVTGAITITYGSVSIEGTNYSGTLNVTGEVDISGIINNTQAGGAGLVINATPGSEITIDKNLTIGEGGLTINNTGAADAEPVNVLILEGVNVDIDTILSINTDVRVNNYGNVVGGTVKVAEDGTFYSATAVDTTFTGPGNIDLGDAMETLQISDKLASSAVLKPTQNVLINGNLTIKSGEYLVITGSMDVAEGVTVTINEGGLLMVYGPAASADIKGTIISKGEFKGVVPDVAEATGAAGFTYYDGKSIDISGTINAKKATSEDVRTVWINGDSEISGTVTIDSKAKAQFGGETKIVAGGVLNINGTYSGTILNQGTVNLNGSVDSGATVAMNSVDAVLNVTALKGANALQITDAGLYLQTTDAGDRLSVPQTDRPANVITIQNVKGVTVTEGYTYSTDDEGDRVVKNNMYIAGTIDAQNSKDFKCGNLSVDAGTLTVSGELTIATVSVNITGEMKVTGTVYVTENDEAETPFQGSGELTVTGLVRTVEDITDAVADINAVKYEQTIENIPYYFYTNLADAIASGEENLTVLGDLWILENTTIPNGITVDASAQGTTVYVGSNEDDITDITLTVANGGLLMAQKVVVDATMMIENTDTGIDCNNIISDVSSTTETTAKYTNIYTALNEAQSGETVTITKKADNSGKAIVSIIRDVEIKDGVTLMIPGINTLQIAEGVTLTNNGTLDVRGSVVASDADKDGTARFGTATTVTISNVDKECAVIINNGTIVSVSKMEYGVENTSGYNIPGAYYTINGKFYITPVEDAVAQIGNTETDSITIFGKNTVGAVTFVGTVEEPVKVTIDSTADITAESMTVNNGTIIANAGAQLNGTFGGVNGTIVLTNMVVSDSATLTVEDKAVTVSEQTSQVTYVSGAVEYVAKNADKLVNSVEFNGAVSIDEKLTVISGTDKNDFVAVGSGATLTVVGNAAEIETSKLTVNGTLVADDAGIIDVDTVVIAGTMNVMDKTDKTEAGKIDITSLYVGGEPGFDYAATSAAAVNGDLTGVKTVYVFAQATLDEAAIETVSADAVKNTEFYIEGTLWMTVYDVNVSSVTTIQTAGTGNNAKPTYDIAPNNLTNSVFGGWQVLQDGKYVTVSKTLNVGDEEAVYAYINYDIYTITVFADPGISAVYIDGKLMTEGYYQEPINGQWTQGFKLNVAAGNHEITYKLGNYFSGEAQLTINGTAVSGNTFTTSGTEPDDRNVTIYMQGIEASAPETPSTGGSSDDGMGLTDYLLIILVILIVVMAIMVAMRLMRS